MARPSEQRPGQLARTLKHLLRRMARDNQAMATVEFALTAGLIITAMVNAVDVATYYFHRMEVQNATQMGAQAAWQACDTSKLPATTNCPGLSAAVTAGIQASSLGTAVTLQSGYPAEGYYCLNASNALQYMSSVSSKPANCSAAGNAAAQPVDYIRVQTSYVHTPIFGSASVTALLPSPITAMSLMRLE